MTTAIVLIVAVVAGWMVQMHLTMKQSTDFNRQVLDLRGLGTLSVGLAGRRYRGGRAYVAIAVADDVVRGALTLSGWTTFSRGEELPALIGLRVGDLLSERPVPGLSTQQREAARQAADYLRRGVNA